MELFGPKVKNFLIFFQKNVFLIFWEMKLSLPKNFVSSKNKQKNTPKKIFIFRELQLSSQKLKKLINI